MFLEESGLPYRIEPVNISRGEQFKPDFLRISPNNRMPAIVDHAPADGGEPLAVFESGAILLYLADKIHRFIPADLRGRNVALQWLFWQMGGLGPMAGTLALAMHTTGVLGRLFSEAVENAPPGPAEALRTQGVGPLRVFLYATLPQVLPQLMSYTLYRWENNIRAAAVLGVVGAGGLGQLLSFHMGLFHMGKTATVLGAMLLLVALVDGLSYASRRWLTR
jgi:hypothetical protein